MLMSSETEPRMEWKIAKLWHFDSLSDTQKLTAGFLLDLIAIRDGQLFLPVATTAFL